jgi:predicted ATPase
MALMVRQVHTAGYRSIRAIRFPVDRLTVFVGANGVGKTNLYRALQLIQASAAGTLSAELAGEGGMDSALWAGTRPAKGPVRISVGVEFAHFAGAERAYGYEVAVGLGPRRPGGPGEDDHIPASAAFLFEPQVKEESLVFYHGRRIVKLLDRRGGHAAACNEAGNRVEIEAEILASETVLAALQDPTGFPDLHLIRRTMLDWRFYHEMRTDAGSPLRRPCLAVTSPTLASDGSNLAAVFATLVHIREDTAALESAIEDAFPGARLVVPQPEREASFGLVFPDYPKRIFTAGELSDGTLRYLALAGALLAYRLPAFIALNEPETSLHPDLLEPLARLIARSAERTQIWLVTHSERLAAALAEHGALTPRTVVKRKGETWIEGLRLAGDFGEDDD